MILDDGAFWTWGWWADFMVTTCDWLKSPKRKWDMQRSIKTPASFSEDSFRWELSFQLGEFSQKGVQHDYGLPKATNFILVLKDDFWCISFLGTFRFRIESLHRRFVVIFDVRESRRYYWTPKWLNQPGTSKPTKKVLQPIHDFCFQGPGWFNKIQGVLGLSLFVWFRSEVRTENHKNPIIDKLWPGRIPQQII